MNNSVNCLTFYFAGPFDVIHIKIVYNKSKENNIIENCFGVETRNFYQNKIGVD